MVPTSPAAVEPTLIVDPVKLTISAGTAGALAKKWDVLDALRALKAIAREIAAEFDIASAPLVFRRQPLGEHPCADGMAVILLAADHPERMEIWALAAARFREYLDGLSVVAAEKVRDRLTFRVDSGAIHID